MDIKTKLEEARALVAKGWCQNAAASDEKGYPSDLGVAPRHCLWGSVHAVTGARFDDDAEAVLAPLRSLVPCGGVTAWNDEPGRTQAEVLALFDKAIESARGDA